MSAPNDPIVLAGRYRLEAVIGHGGMADVYRARDELLGRLVAVKLFRPGAGEAGDERRQDAEMRLLASLTHPGLVTVFDGGTFTGPQSDAVTGLIASAAPRLYLVMELVDGESLYERVERGPLPAAEVASIGAQMADALSYVHGRGVVHRDIKPGNVLLTSAPGPGGLRPGAKLADFGIARTVDDTHLTALGKTLGTASYLSPEQARGQEVGPRSDIYSLGLVLLEALTGRRAYPGTAIETAVARLERPPDIPASLGPQWVSLLSDMTSMLPGARPDAAPIARALRSAAGDGVPAAVPAALPEDSTSLLGPPTAGRHMVVPAPVPLPPGLAVRADQQPDDVAPVGPGRPLWPWITALAVLIAAVVVVVVALALRHSGSSTPTPTPSTSRPTAPGTSSGSRPAPSSASSAPSTPTPTPSTPAPSATTPTPTPTPTTSAPSTPPSSSAPPASTASSATTSPPAATSSTPQAAPAPSSAATPASSSPTG